MGTEIERKFLVSGTGWKNSSQCKLIRQGYISTHPDRVVRVRIYGDEAFLTIKSRVSELVRHEFEYDIPVADANSMLDNIAETPIIEKTRWLAELNGMIWEIDEFHGENEGLIVAEIELNSVDQEFTKPDWVGREVSGDPRYLNANLISNPFSKW